jgi:hypothetical protein
MIATVKPVDREEYALDLDSEPVFSSTLPGGYETATLDCELSDEQRLNVMGGRLRIHGETGIVWQGIVSRRPGEAEPLTALGWGYSATMGRREALYCDTALTPWASSDAAGNAPGTSIGTDSATLQFVLQPGSYKTGNIMGIWREIPSTTSLRFTIGGFSRPSSYFRVDVYVRDGSSYGTAKATISTTGAQDIDVSGGTDYNAIKLVLKLTSDYSPSSTIAPALSGLKVYGVAGVTSPTTYNVAYDVFANEVATDHLPSGAAYLAWLEAQATAVEPLVFASCSAAGKMLELAKYAAFDYGWYMELVSGTPYCVPHWTARSTTPDYIVRLEEAESHDLDESSIEELASAVRVSYQTAEGRSTYTDVLDTDTSHPLVALGITRYGDLQLQSASSTTATTYGGIYLSENGREQVKGRVVTRNVYTAAGAPAYLPDLRPGKMVRVMGLPDGQRDCIIKRITCAGDTLATIEMDNDPYRLDILLARLAKRQT